jgi:hypothetical protein
MEYKIQHRHGDGSWAPMDEVPREHGPADHDPERSWGFRRIFRCTRCDETVTVTPGDEGAPPPER